MIIHVILLEMEERRFLILLTVRQSKMLSKTQGGYILKKMIPGEMDSRQIFLFYIPSYNFMMLPCSVSNIHFCLIKAALCEQYEDFH